MKPKKRGKAKASAVTAREAVPLLAVIRENAALAARLLPGCTGAFVALDSLVGRAAQAVPVEARGLLSMPVALGTAPIGRDALAERIARHRDELAARYGDALASEGFPAGALAVAMGRVVGLLRTAEGLP